VPLRSTAFVPPRRPTAHRRATRVRPRVAYLVEAGEAAAVAHARVRTALLVAGARAHAAPRRATNTRSIRTLRELREKSAGAHDERSQRTHPPLAVAL
jgi:hypothetical protein